MAAGWLVVMVLAVTILQGKVANCSTNLPSLYLRGGEAVRTTERKDKNAVATMELDENEDAARVKSRHSDRQGNFLQFPSTHTSAESIGQRVDTPVRFHAHGNKVVMEQGKRRPKLAKTDRTSVATAKIDKRKRKVLKRTSVNCTLAVAHNLFNLTDFAVYLKQRMKVDGQLGHLDGSIAIDVDNEAHTVIVSAFKASQLKKKRVWSKRLFLADTLSSRYVRYLTKKWICKLELKDFIRCISTDFSKASLAKGGSGSKFEIRYTNIYKNRHLRHKMSRRFGTRLEQARRSYIDSLWRAHDANKTHVSRPELMMERKIKATGERVGGMEHVAATRKTVAESEAESMGKLKYWIAEQRAAYRMPFGGAMRGMLDRSICRHDPDRVGKGTSTHSTAGYSSPRALRCRTGLRVGMESMLYTGTAPNGFKSVARKAVAQRLLERYQKTRREVSKGYSVQGEADRRIYNWKPKWLLAGKMDLHKRDWR